MIDWTKPLRIKDKVLSGPVKILGREEFYYAVSVPGVLLLVDADSGSAISSGGREYIVENIPPTRKQIIFTETGEVRAPRRGEWYFDFDGFTTANEDYLTHWPIYTRTERDVE